MSRKNHSDEYGYYAPKKRKKNSPRDIITMVAGIVISVVLILLIFTLGVEIGADEQVVASLGSIGLSALVITLFVLAGSVLAVLLVRKCMGLDRQGRSAAPAEERGGEAP